MWLLLSTMTSCPGWVCARMASWFAIVPEGTNSANRLLSSAAAISWSRLTVGSSPYTSSPTSARAMAFLIPSVGTVTVSLRKSIIRRLSSHILVPHSSKFSPGRRKDTCYTALYGRGRSSDTGSMGRLLWRQAGRTRPIGLGIHLFFLPALRLLHPSSCSRRNGHRRRHQESPLDDDRNVCHHAGRDASVRVAFSSMLALSTAAERVRIFHHQSVGVLCLDGRSCVSGVGGPWIFCLAVGVQPVCCVRVLEFHGRPVYAGAGSQTVRGHCRRREQRSITRSASHNRVDVCFFRAGTNVGLFGFPRVVPRLCVSAGAMGA